MTLMRRLRRARRRSMRRSMRRVPFFPLIPLGPIALFAGSLYAALRALARVRRLERELGRSPA